MHCTRTGSTASLRRTTSVHCTRLGSTSLKPRTTRVQRTRNGVHISQITEYPRGAYTQRGSHQSIHGSPACGVHATGSTSVKARITHVLARYGVHASRSTDYPRGARATGSTQVHPRTTHVEREQRGLHKSIRDYSRERTDTLALYMDTSIVPILFK